MEKFIADLVKGASASLRENGGPGVNVLVDRENRGREEKLAAFMPSLAQGLGKAIGYGAQHPGMVAPALGALGGAAVGAATGESGHRLEGAGKGALAGGALGFGAQKGMQHMVQNHGGSMAQGAMGVMRPTTPSTALSVRPQDMGWMDSFMAPKMGNFGGVGAVLGSNIGGNPLLGNLSGRSGAAIGAGLGADPGRGLQAALGAGAGHMLGQFGAGMLGDALHINPTVMRDIGGMLGGAAGGQYMGHDDRDILERLQGKQAAISLSYVAGVKAAAAAFGIKEAGGMLGLAGSVLGPMAARAGIGAAAKGALGAGAAGLAGKIAPRIAGGLGGAALDTAASLGGGMLGSKVGPQQRPQQPPPM